MKTVLSFPSRFKPWIVLMLVLLSVGVVSVYWLSRPTVKLERTEYDIAIALYRVCNSRSKPGVDQIETLLERSGEAHAVGDDSRAVFMSIIEQARAEKWRVALHDCRQLLEDQVQR